MPLKLRLKPSEKLVLNGAVISAGDGGATLVLHNKAALLRAKDIIQEQDANTPAKRLYFQIMLMYLDAENRESYMDRYMEYALDLMKTTSLIEVKRSLMYIHNDIAANEFYRALKTCQAVIAVEAALLEGKAGTSEEIESLIKKTINGDQEEAAEETA